MDLESRRRWEHYTKAKEAMLERTHIPEAPWWVVEADDKKRARLNCIHHLLEPDSLRAKSRTSRSRCPTRVHNPDYLRGPIPRRCTCRTRYRRGASGGGRPARTSPNHSRAVDWGQAARLALRLTVLAHRLRI